MKKLSPFIPAALLAATLSLGGCSFISGLFGGGSHDHHGTLASPYDGLANKTLAVVIYAPAATLNEYTGAREEISDFVRSQLRENLPTTHLLNPTDVITWQNEHLNWYAVSERDIGKHFTVDRVLYIEVLDYSTRRVIGGGDMQGRLRAKCKIVNSEPTATGTDPEWTGIIDVAWPPDRPLDPTQTNESAVRLRLLESFAQRLVECFYNRTGVGPDMHG